MKMTDMTLYASARIESARKDETNDCAVVALSIVLDESYDRIHSLLAAEGRRKGHGTYRHQQEKVLTKICEEKGWSWEWIDTPMQVWSKNDIGYFSTKSIVKHKAFAQGEYLLYSHAHVSAMVNGQVEDWAASRKKVVKHVIQITK